MGRQTVNSDELRRLSHPPEARTSPKALVREEQEEESRFADIMLEQLADAAHESFGYPQRAKEVASSLSRSRPPFVYAICGALGSGKTSFLRFLVNELPCQSTVVVYFNAWHGSIHSDVRAAFVHQLKETLAQAAHLPGLSLRMAELRTCIGVLWRSALVAFSTTSAVTKFFTGVYREAMREVRQEACSKIEAERQTRQQFEGLGKILAEQGIQVYVLIDELDRCPPPVVTDVLHAHL